MSKLPPNDLDTEYTAAEVAQAEAATPRLIPVLRSLGSEHEPRPDWQQRVFATVDGEDRRDRLSDYVKGALIGVVFGGVLAVIVAYLAGWL